MKRTLPLLILTLLALLAPAAHAQEITPEPAPTATEPTAQIEIIAEDGLRLRGDYFASPRDGDRPAMLLLHQLYTTRLSWGAVIEPLLSSGFDVLAVDLRGYGLTRGALNWGKAQSDTQLWLDWLAAEPGIRDDAIFLMGSSMGSNLALAGCASEDAPCAGAVALSPGLEYFGVGTAAAFMAGPPALVVYADRDSIPRRDVPRMIELLEEAGRADAVTFVVYPGRAHGIQLLAEPDLLPQIIAWLIAQSG
jgi:alpha-beta hydrolase superfamily lysophospholipase